MKTSITIPFKGARNYAQIADIFTGMVDACIPEGASGLVFTVHAPLLTAHAVVEVFETETKPESGYAARMEFRDIEGVRRLAVVRGIEGSASEPPRRAFDEDALRSRIKLNGHAASFGGETESQFAELITAMNKKLLESLFPDGDSKWWAARIRLSRLPGSWREVRLICQDTEPARLYSSIVELDGVELGEINFVLRPN